MSQFFTRFLVFAAIGLSLNHMAYAADTRNSNKMATPNQAQIRCWQYGKLVLDESALQMLSTANNMNSQVVFNSTNNPRQTVYVTEIGSSTCLIRKEDLSY